MFAIGETVYFICKPNDWIKRYPNEVYVLSGTVDAQDFIGEDNECTEYQIVKQKTNFIVPSYKVFATREEAEAKLKQILGK